ncbi:hypothetical protein UCRNP2_2844 [Neofusicoccum parvum UCRNP2]|uniref:Uncharacterized protein n=1 Tax=Botryosphaeria parva (strain UCR-NP2) TaxID=1287680 RepID=R1GQ31_BOTPV|nr:hypothetical protein UCRNP2_2844 [Neofusicoccum parvum UCRNP2]
MEFYDEETVATQAEEIESLKQEIRDLQEKNRNLQNNNANAEVTVAVAQDHYSESQAKLKALEEKCRNETKSLEEKAKEARAELKDCKDQLQKKQEDSDNLTKERDALQAELEDLKSPRGAHGRALLQLLTTQRVLDVKISDNNAKDAIIADLTRKLRFMGSKFVAMTQDIDTIMDHQASQTVEKPNPVTPKMAAASIASSEEKPSPGSLASELEQVGSDSDSDRSPSPSGTKDADEHGNGHAEDSGSGGFMANSSPAAAVKHVLAYSFATASSTTASPSAVASSKAASSFVDDNEDSTTDSLTTVDDLEQTDDGPSTPDPNPRKNDIAKTTNPRTPTSEMSPIPNEFGSPQSRQQPPLNSSPNDPFRAPVSNQEPQQQPSEAPPPPPNQPSSSQPSSQPTSNLVDPATYESLFRPVTPPYGQPDYRQGRWDALFDGNLALMHARHGRDSSALPPRLLAQRRRPAGNAFVPHFPVAFLKRHHPAAGPYDARDCVAMFPGERHERLRLFWENEGVGEEEGDGDDDEIERLRAENAVLRRDEETLKKKNEELEKDKDALETAWEKLRNSPDQEGVEEELREEELRREELRTVRGPTVETRPEPMKLEFPTRSLPDDRQQQQQPAFSGLERMLERILKGGKGFFHSVPCDRYHVFPWVLLVFLVTLLTLFYFAADAEQERLLWLTANDAATISSIIHANSRYGARVGAPLPRTVIEPADNLTLDVSLAHPWFWWGEEVPLQVVQGIEVVAAKLTGRR